MSFGATRSGKRVQNAYLTRHLGWSQGRNGVQRSWKTPIVLDAHMWAKWLHNPYRLGSPQSRERMKIRYITFAIFGAHMWPKWLHNPPPPCRPWGSPKRGRDQNRLHNPCHLGGPHVGKQTTRHDGDCQIVEFHHSLDGGWRHQNKRCRVMSLGVCLFCAQNVQHLHK